MRKILSYLIIFLIISLIGHSYSIYRFIYDGVLFTGPNDGMEQMIPIQLYLFDQWSQGHWFYATDFGLGGDFFQDLAYYFSTNILFIINVIVIHIIQLFVDLNTDMPMFWMINAIIISIIKATIAMFATWMYAKYITRNQLVSILGAALFVISPLYFRFTVYWPFFSDIFIWLPLLLLSIELFLRQKKLSLFIIVVALSLINNFYFGYYQLLTGLIYFAFRIIFQHRNDIARRFESISKLSVAALLGLGCSLFIFFHSIQGFLGNRRTSYDVKNDWIEPLNVDNNIFYDNYLIVILFVVIQALLSFKLYKHYYYRLFTIFTWLAIIATFFPIGDQVFNGFSAPQKRWHYLLAFTTAILIAQYIKYFSTQSIKWYIVTSVIALAIVFGSAYEADHTVAWVWFTPIVCLCGLFVLIMKSPIDRRRVLGLYSLSVFMLAILVTFVFIKYQIYFEDHQERANTYEVKASMYDTPQQRRLVKQMDQHKAADERIDWRVNEQDNTPMYQHFKGLSLYSSIFDHHILDTYYDDLKINLKEESVSRYQSTNARQNIDSLWSVKYLMLKDDQQGVPAHFSKKAEEGQYRIYENDYNLNGVRISDHIYNEATLAQPIDREHAMLDGIVMANEGKNYTHNAPNLLKQLDVTTENINFEDSKSYKAESDINQQRHINVTQDAGTIKLSLPQSLREKYKDFYLELKVKRGEPDSNYTVGINDYENHRLFNGSTYKTGIHRQLYRAQPDENGNISITLSPQGGFDVTLKGLYGEDYSRLLAAHQRDNLKYHYTDINNGVKIQLGDHQKGMAAVNIPYRKGMTAYIDGNKIEPTRVNYMMTGVPVKQDTRTITIKYRPPYWYTMIIVSMISIILSIWFVRKNKNSHD
ncbi:YfhO family protein [Staphylococcus auricularis]|uniref:Integral membrane protein n=1 Tax=Staphylococcus auricularis TaxID=29379 RepID=A0ABX5IJ15_9STAP|nr:YfhO family protein [Staphylococcus auricularis]PTH19891.1 hypothetical protein BU607_00455 [Staphylococcus auricularis]